MPGAIPLRSFEAPGGGSATCIDLDALLADRKTELPACLKVVLENVARQELAGGNTKSAVAALVGWSAGAPPAVVPLRVSRLILPDSSGLPVLMDLAAARDRMVEMGEDPAIIEPSVPVTLVIDHSLIVDFAGHPNARQKNIAEEYRRNSERYAFFKWAQQAFDKLKVVPPGAGIIHQVHLESLARVVDRHDVPGHEPLVAPEFVLGCDSHTPMVNGLGLLAWGVGGMDGEAAALGKEYVVRIPRIVGVRLSGRLPAGSTTTDLVLSVTERLRQVGVTGDFVEFFGPGLADLTVPDRATLSNMAPEYGATVGYFPIDEQTIAYLRQSGREEDHLALVEGYARAAGLFVEEGAPEAEYSEVVEMDLGSVAPCVAGPRRPQDRVPLTELSRSFRDALVRPVAEGGFGVAAGDVGNEVPVDGVEWTVRHGTITIAAITSCTNTSNPAVMIGAGLLARNAVARGLSVPEWVKTSMAPGSRLVEDYLRDAGLMEPLETLGFHVVGFGCTTCSGKSGPIRPEIAEAVREGDLVAVALLSGNRNFDGRIHKTSRANYLASPPLVVAFALAGRADVDFEAEPIGLDADGRPVMLREVWPDPGELQALVADSQKPDRYRASYSTLFDGADLWQRLPAATGPRFDWDPSSTYIRRPPFFEEVRGGVPDLIEGGRVLVKVGDSLTTDHVTPSGEILPDSQAGRFLIDAGVAPEDFNAVTQRRGNHDFMARITFANQRMNNHLVPETEGGFTRTEPDGDVTTIYDAAMRLRDQGAPAIVLAGRDYGMGSSRDWAAKGPMLLGVRVVLAKSFERIHRSNLLGMGIVPLVFREGEDADSLGLTGFETYRFEALHDAVMGVSASQVTAVPPNGKPVCFEAQADVVGDQERQLLMDGGLFCSLLKEKIAAA